jgi:hypothetical protein
MCNTASLLITVLNTAIFKLLTAYCLSVAPTPWLIVIESFHSRGWCDQNMFMPYMVIIRWREDKHKMGIWWLSNQLMSTVKIDTFEHLLWLLPPSAYICSLIIWLSNAEKTSQRRHSLPEEYALSSVFYDIKSTWVSPQQRVESRVSAYYWVTEHSDY